MRITYLKLVNFKHVLSAMNRHMLEIDLSKSANRVVLLLGDNGSGKTTIMSQLHPFPNNGNTDQRGIKDILIEGKEAYKEVHFLDGHDKYVVKHFYSKSGSVKSYIAKNDEELNPNGNVTSFNECLYTEFTLATDFLNLLRLGSNDSNFIKMSATERKKYTTTLLDDVKVYAKLFKTVSEDLRVLKTILKNVADKLNKLKVYSLQDLKNEISDIEKSLLDLRNAKDTLIYDRANLNAKLESALKGRTISSIGDSKIDTEAMIKSLNKTLSKLDDIDSTEVLDITISKLTSELEKFVADKERYEEDLVSQVNAKTEYQNNIDKFTLQLGNFNINEVNRLRQVIADYKERLETEFAGYKDTKLKYSTSDMREALELMEAINNVCKLMLGFNNKAKLEVVNMYRENPSVNHEKDISEMYSIISSKLERANNSKSMQQHKDAVKPAGMRFMFKPAGCQYSNCSMEEFYRTVTSTEKFDSSTIDKTIVKLERELEEIDDYYAINSNIQYIKMILESNSKLISKVPQDLFLFDNILRSIATEEPFFDEVYVTKLINIGEKHDKYNEITNTIAELKEKLSIYEENSSAMMLINDEIEKYKVKVKEIDLQMTATRNKIAESNSAIKTYEETLEELIENRNMSNEKDDMVAKLKELNTELTELIYISELIDTTAKHEKSINNSISETEYNIRHQSELLETLRRNMVSYLELNKEKEELESKFEDLTIIREALSSTKGIPLLYMRIYMMDSLTQINELLDIVYDGSLEVQPFIIDEDVFKIPYMKNGIQISDVRSCSQGEETFLSMAISFAFISRSIDRYNIMLLDEIDAALDQRRRQSFLDTLEAQLNYINAEQVFIITHNNAFYDYPVDVIMTSDVSMENYKNVNVLFSVVE